MILNLKDLFLDILFPKFCVGCGREGKYICERCNIFNSETEPIYFKQEKYGLDSLISIWEYEGLIKKAIHQIKYQGITDIIKELMDMIDCGGDLYGRSGQPQGLPLQITYVPMYKKRERNRGFNQAKIIAEELGKKTGFQIMPLLRKIKDTKPQMKLKQEERLKNIKGCFKLIETRPLENSNEEAVRGRVSKVVLVDDVYTTGATMKECAKVLKKAGIEKVTGFVLARTV